MISKTDLVELISKKYDLPKTKINSIVSSVFTIIKDEVIKNDLQVQIQKFGKFEKKTSHIKKGLDVLTNEMVIVRKRETLKFTASK